MPNEPFDDKFLFDECNVWCKNRQDVIDLIQEGIDMLQKMDVHLMTTSDWNTVQYAFDDMSEWFLEVGEEQEHEN